MFTRTIDTAVWLFVEEYGEMMLACDALHQIHHQLVMVICQVAVFENGGQLKLVGSYFVVTGFHRYAQFVAFYFKLFHKGCDTWRDGAEVMIFQLLILSRRVSHQGTSSQSKVRTRII